MANYTCGLDLGQVNDWSALVVAEHCLKADGQEERVRNTDWGPTTDMVPRWRDCFDVVGILRWRGTAYPAIVDEVCLLLTELPLRGRCSLVVDATGVGRPVLDLFDQATRENRLDFWSDEVTLTGGEKEGERGRTVPKFEIVRSVEVLLQTKRLRVVPTIPLADVLRAELENFRATVTLTGRVRLEAEGTGHDDIVMALAMAVWKPKWTGSPRRRLQDGTLYDPDQNVVGGEVLNLPGPPRRQEVTG
jgi:hypothetical protein